MPHGRAVCRLAAAAATLVSMLLAVPATAGAQPVAGPPGPFAIDARGALVRLKPSGRTAGAIGVPQTSLPGLGLGLDFGAHWYVLRTRKITLGVGASVLVSRGRKTPTDEEGQPTGPTIETRFITIAPQVSLNFGTARGWSYLSGGLGRSVYDTRLAETPVDNARKARTINYGGGARWFAKKHLAFALDLRFYAVSGQEATTSLVATDPVTMMVFSLGVAFR
jgi:hypothetical protein